MNNAIIWRYLSFPKFVSLIDSSCLFFCRADLLNDKQEGISPISQLESLFRGNIDDDKIDSMIKIRLDSEKTWKKYTAVNCWHINDFESYAMWGNFSNSDFGIALKSSKEKLIDSFLPSLKHEIRISKVKYGNYDKITFGNVMHSNYFHKRYEFSYEKELRAFINTDITIEDHKLALKEGEDLFTNGGLINGRYIDNEKLPGIRNGGIKIEVDLKKLIDEIVVSPNASKWMVELVENISKKYKYNFKVTKSKI